MTSDTNSVSDRFTKSNSKPGWICLLKVIVTGQYFSHLYKAIREQINFDTFLMAQSLPSGGCNYL